MKEITMLPDGWEEIFDRLYDRTYIVLITAGCDHTQADAIAKARVEDTVNNLREAAKKETKE